MGKRKQRKNQEEHKNNKQVSKEKDREMLENQENCQMKGNYQTPNKRDIPIKSISNSNNNHSQTNQLQVNQEPQKLQNIQHLSQQSSNQKVSVNDQSQLSAPSCQLKDRPTKIQIQMHKNNQTSQTQNNKQQCHLENIKTPQEQQQFELNERNLKTLLQSQKQLTKPQPLSGSHQLENGQIKNLQKNVQNSFMLQIDNSHKRQEYQIEDEFDSGIDEDEYGDEEYEDDLIQSAFQQNSSSNLVGAGVAQNCNYYYDEIEATQYAKNIHDSASVTIQQQQQNQLGIRNFSTNKGGRHQTTSNNSNNMVKDIQQLSMETLIQGDEQIQSDIKFCLYCIYNNHDISQYFKQLLRIQRRLKEWSFQLNPNILFNIFEDNIKEFMHGIRDKLIDEMKQLQMIKQKPSSRRYSFDDYFLIDKTFSRSYSLHGYNNEILNHCMKYMLDSKYESIRNDLRHRIWSEMRKNNEIIVSFYQQPDAYQRIFDLLIKFYTRVRDSILGIEEMWVFFMESVFHQELRGNMIFEQFHKQIFKKDILSHRYIQSFLKEINEVQVDLENRRQNKIQNQLDPIIENISQILFDLDEDLNFQYPEETDSQNEQNLLQPQESNNQDNEDQLEEEIGQDGDECSDSDLIITYQQLQEKIKVQYGGLSLAQQVEQYSSQTSNYLNILQSIQQDKRCQELMKNLPNLDTDTLCYIIENNLTHKDYEMILLQNQQKNQKPIQISNPKDQQQQNPDDVIISPTKNLNFLNQYFNAIGAEDGQDQNNSMSEEDEDDEVKAERQMEKKKRKNMKKKRKRKEKKIMAQHQNQLEELLKLKLLEEQQKRGFNNEQVRNQLRKKLIEHLGIEQNDVDQYLSTFQPPKYAQKKSQSNDLQTKQTQCDENSDIDAEQEQEFEKDLELFRQRLESGSQALRNTRKAKLVPNIPQGWIDQLRQRLNSFYQCQSPKSSMIGKGMIDYGKHSDGLWVKSYQHSA